MLIKKYHCTLLILFFLLLAYPLFINANINQRKSKHHKQIYIIKKNDTLWNISAKQLNRAILWPKIYHANPYIVDPNLIYPKKQLIILDSKKFTLLRSAWFIDLAYGFGFNNLPQDNMPPNTAGWGNDIYRADKIMDTPITSFTIGYKFANYSLGLRYSYLFSTQIDGRISLMGGRIPNAYRYSYKINSQTLMLVGKVGLYSCQKFKPYLIFGIGAAANNFSNYTENVIINTLPELSPDYGNKITTQLAYSLGLGFSYQWSKHWQTAIEYQWQNLGKASSTYGKGSYSNDKLTQDYQLNTLMLHLTYVF